MSFPNEDAQYLTATAESGMLVIHSVPTTLSWIPLDVVNRVYNVGGTVTVGTFESVDAAKQAAAERYAVCIGSWQITDVGLAPARILFADGVRKNHDTRSYTRPSGANPSRGNCHPVHVSAQG